MEYLKISGSLSRRDDYRSHTIISINSFIITRANWRRYDTIAYIDANRTQRWQYDRFQARTQFSRRPSYFHKQKRRTYYRFQSSRIFHTRHATTLHIYILAFRPLDIIARYFLRYPPTFSRENPSRREFSLVEVVTLRNRRRRRRRRRPAFRLLQIVAVGMRDMRSRVIPIPSNTTYRCCNRDATLIYLSGVPVSNVPWETYRGRSIAIAKSGKTSRRRVAPVSCVSRARTMIILSRSRCRAPFDRDAPAVLVCIHRCTRSFAWPTRINEANVRGKKKTKTFSVGIAATLDRERFVERITSFPFNRELILRIAVAPQ